MDKQEKTLVVIKPDGVQRGLVGEIISRFEKCGLKLAAIKMVSSSEELAGAHYVADPAWLHAVGAKQKESYKEKGITLDLSEEEIGHNIRNLLIEFLTLSPVIVLVIQGHNAIAHVRKVVGPTSPQDAPAGTIRGDFSFDTYQLADVSKRPIQNLIHASESKEEAEREIKVWFKPEEIHEWKRVDEALLYRHGSEE